jgi:DNA-directed RNA polymerase sigma subunit (sigma70/sigma32)
MKKNSLEKETDLSLVTKVKEKSCNSSLKELISRHGGICFSMGKKFSSNSNFNIYELTDNKDWIIYSAALSFDGTKGAKFSTWLANQVKFYCLNLKNKTSRYVETENDTIEFLVNQYHNSCNDKSNKKELINTLFDLLDQIKDENMKRAIHYRYFSNKEKILNYCEIGKILNVTPQTVLNWHNKFIDLAKKKLTSKSNIDII